MPHQYKQVRILKGYRVEGFEMRPREHTDDRRQIDERGGEEQDAGQDLHSARLMT